MSFSYNKYSFAHAALAYRLHKYTMTLHHLPAVPADLAEDHRQACFWQILNFPCLDSTGVLKVCLSPEVNFPTKSYKVRQKREKNYLWVFVHNGSGWCLHFVNFTAYLYFNLRILNSSSVAGKGTGVSIYNRFGFIRLVFTSSFLCSTFATC